MKHWILLTLIFCFSISRAEEIRVLARKLKNVKNDVAEQDKKKRYILGQLYQINREIKTMNEEFAELNDRVLYLERNAKGIGNEIFLIEQKIQDQKIELGRRMSAIYKLSELGLLRFLINQKGMGNVDKNLRYLKLVMDRDYELIEGYKSSLTKLAKKQDHLKSRVRRLISNKKDLKLSESNLEQQQQNKVKLLQHLREDHSKQIQTIKTLRKQVAKNFEGEIDENVLEMIKESFFEQKGRLQPPVEGVVVRKYGLIKDDTYFFHLSHKGIFYATKPKENVQVVFSGKVAFVNNIPGKQNVVIVDHGNNYYTTYGNLKKVSVEEGDRVNRNQMIGTVDREKFGSYTGLYFEIRHFSESIDPEKWFEKKLLVENQISEQE